MGMMEPNIKSAVWFLSSISLLPHIALDKQASREKGNMDGVSGYQYLKLKILPVMKQQRAMSDLVGFGFRGACRWVARGNAGSKYFHSILNDCVQEE